MKKIGDIQYAGITKCDIEDQNGEWDMALAAAFKEVTQGGEEELRFCSSARGLNPSTINEQNSITAFFGLSATEALKGVAAIEQAVRDIAEHRITLDIVPDWIELTAPCDLKDLYKPALNI